MNKKDRIIIIVLFVLLLLLIGRLVYLLVYNEEVLTTNKYVNTDAISGLAEKAAINKMAMHIQKSFPLPIFIRVQNDKINEENILKLYSSWNRNNPNFKHYCIFILLSFDDKKISFIAGERLRIYLNEKRIQKYIDGKFQIDIDNGRFAKAINDLVNLLYEELQGDKNSIIEELNREKKRVDIEKFTQKWYFIVSGLLVIFLLYLYLRLMKRYRCGKCGSSFKTVKGDDEGREYEDKVCKKCGLSIRQYIEKSRNVKKVERLGSLKKDWK